LYGGSRGAEGALLIASYEPHLFDAVVANSPSYLINGAFGGREGAAAWTFHGKPLAARTIIPVANIRIPVLLGDGGQDEIWDSSGAATAIIEELAQQAGARLRTCPPGRCSPAPVAFWLS
jgi:hypothetical protein